ncbi:uterine gland development [Batrachochytrium dendrobatidis]|nr:uterine gland development [Batrachochytrium dendrobatidis]KAK5668572.1 uterine gland development [Batrachochytrium dendrobatidis]
MSSKRARTIASYKLEIPVSSEDNSDDEVTRCICGDTASKGVMVQCDECGVWQHCDCMNLAGKKLPKKYFCEQCKPESHPSIIPALAVQSTSSKNIAETSVNTNLTYGQDSRNPQRQSSVASSGMSSLGDFQDGESNFPATAHEQPTNTKSPSTTLSNSRFNVSAKDKAAALQMSKTTPKRKSRQNSIAATTASIATAAKKRNTLNSRVADQWNAELLLMQTGDNHTETECSMDVDGASEDGTDHDPTLHGTDPEASVPEEFLRSRGQLGPHYDSFLNDCSKSSLLDSGGERSRNQSIHKNDDINEAREELDEGSEYTNGRKRLKRLNSVTDASTQDVKVASPLGKSKKERRSKSKRVIQEKSQSEASPLLMDSDKFNLNERKSSHVSKTSEIDRTTEGEHGAFYASLSTNPPVLDDDNTLSGRSTNNKRRDKFKKLKGSTRKQSASALECTVDRDSDQGLAKTFSLYEVETNKLAMDHAFDSSNVSDSIPAAHSTVAEDESMPDDMAVATLGSTKKKAGGRGRVPKSRKKALPGNRDIHVCDDDAYVDTGIGSSLKPGLVESACHPQTDSLDASDILAPDSHSIHASGDHPLKPDSDPICSLRAPPSPPVQPHSLGLDSPPLEIHRRLKQLYEAVQRLRESLGTCIAVVPPEHMPLKKLKDCSHGRFASDGSEFPCKDLSSTMDPQGLDRTCHSMMSELNNRDGPHFSTHSQMDIDCTPIVSSDLASMDSNPVDCVVANQLDDQIVKKNRSALQRLIITLATPCSSVADMVDILEDALDQFDSRFAML